MSAGCDTTTDLSQVFAHRLDVTSGITTAAPVARSGQTTPNKYAQS